MRTFVSYKLRITQLRTFFFHCLIFPPALPVFPRLCHFQDSGHLKRPVQAPSPAQVRSHGRRGKARSYHHASRPARRNSIVTDGRIDAFHLVRGNAAPMPEPHTKIPRSASPFGSLAQLFSEIREVHASALYVPKSMASCPAARTASTTVPFQREAGMVTTNCNFHVYSI